jgi:hypothetical protein
MLKLPEYLPYLLSQVIYIYVTITSSASNPHFTWCPLQQTQTQAINYTHYHCINSSVINVASVIHKMDFRSVVACTTVNTYYWGNKWGS